MVQFKIEILEGGEVYIPAMNLVVQDLTGGDNREYAFNVVAEQLGHSQFTLEEEIAETL